MLIHFAMNISNEGTPVPTCSLEDFGLNPSSVARDLMDLFSKEFGGIQEATWKVKSVT
jgi:hypothetical protein